MDPPAPSPIDGRDATALADLAAGRTIGSEAVVQWLGGWHLARAVLDAAPVRDGGGSSGSDATDAPTVPATLVWTETAVRECHRLSQRLARFGGAGERRMAAALVAAMVTLIVEGADRSVGIAELRLAGALHLRICVADDGIAVLGLRWVGRLED